MTIKKGDFITANGYPGVVYGSPKGKNPNIYDCFVLGQMGFEYGSAYASTVRAVPESVIRANMSESAWLKIKEVADKARKEVERAEARKAKKAAQKA